MDIFLLYRNRKQTDIRFNLNKNGEGNGKQQALSSRRALDGSHLGWGRVVHYLPFNLRWMLNRDEKTEQLVKSIEWFDILGYHMTDLGMDDCHLWIFEVNPLFTF